MPNSVVEICKNSDAVLLGAVGGPKWDNLTGSMRPESGLLKIRKELGAFANLRPVSVPEALAENSPLRPEAVSGLDLFNESEKNLQDKISIGKKLNFGNANLVVAVPDDWIDVQTIADLEEVAFDMRSRRNSRLRVATKYPNLTNNFLISKGVTQYKLIPSLGATETYPFIGSSEIITDITSTGKTLEDNNLRVLKDGQILKSTACLFFAKKKAAKLQPFLNSLG